MRFESKEAAETALREWAATNARRDQMVTSAREVGVSKNRIHTLTGIARTTIDRILEDTMKIPALPTDEDGQTSHLALRHILMKLTDNMVGLSMESLAIEDVLDDLRASLKRLSNKDGEEARR